jgi:2-deoxy-D-gluconate 3-dehydrogenase
MGILEAFSLKGKAAVVTGSNVGLGRAIAVALSEAGADVIGVSRRPGEETASIISEAGGRYRHLQEDLSSSEPVERIVNAALETYGTLDILVNNAGIIRRAEALDFSEQDWDAVINVNLRSLFFLSQKAAGVMVKRGRGGKIINIASMLSYQGGIRVASYTASKSAVIGLTRLLANEWAAEGINVNGIAPGYMETDNTLALRQDTRRNKQILERIPAGRWGKPRDLAGAAVFLASAASDYMHGFIIAVDGGWLAR